MQGVYPVYGGGMAFVEAKGEVTIGGACKPTMEPVSS